MTEMSAREKFTGKYQTGEKIWSGDSFLKFNQWKSFLLELPESQAAAPSREFRNQLTGNMDFVFGELLYSLSEYQGFLRDRAFPLKECYIRPIIKPDSIILEFTLRYANKDGEELTISSEVVRTGKTSYLFCIDYFRPL